MKVEVLHTDEGVQIHLENEDGSKTVWLCDTEQAAIFKLANLLFSAQEDPKQSRRSIMIGDYVKPEEKKALSERAAKVAKDLEKGGLVKKSSVEKASKDAADGQMEELLKKMQQEKFFEPQPYLPLLAPNIKIYPASIPQQIPMMPYIGDLPYDASGCPNWGTPIALVTLDGVSSGLTCSAVLEDTPVGQSVNGFGCITHFFKTSMNIQDVG